jgi:hypothetical protein
MNRLAIIVGLFLLCQVSNAQIHTALSASAGYSFKANAFEGGINFDVLSSHEKLRLESSMLSHIDNRNPTLF